MDEERLNVRLGEFITDDRFRQNLRLRAQNEQYEQRIAELTGWKQEADRVARELSSNTQKYELQISRMLTELAVANTDCVQPGTATTQWNWLRLAAGSRQPE